MLLIEVSSTDVVIDSSQAYKSTTFSGCFSQVVISRMSSMLEYNEAGDKQVTLLGTASPEKIRFNYGPGIQKNGLRETRCL